MSRILSSKLSVFVPIVIGSISCIKVIAVEADSCVAELSSINRYMVEEIAEYLPSSENKKWYESIDIQTLANGHDLVGKLRDCPSYYNNYSMFMSLDIDMGAMLFYLKQVAETKNNQKWIIPIGFDSDRFRKDYESIISQLNKLIRPNQAFENDAQ
jgi:hypothetical protein